MITSTHKAEGLLYSIRDYSIHYPRKNDHTEQDYLNRKDKLSLLLSALHTLG